jgi:hypothetical protein
VANAVILGSQLLLGAMAIPCPLVRQDLVGTFQHGTDPSVDHARRSVVLVGQGCDWDAVTNVPPDQLRLIGS